MYFKYRKIKGKEYKYAVKSVRLPNGKVAPLEKIFKGESKKELEEIFNEKEIKENLKHMLKTFKTNHIFNEEEFMKIEKMRIEFSYIQFSFSQSS